MYILLGLYFSKIWIIIGLDISKYIVIQSCSNAEVDYLIIKGNNIVPLEVKSGSRGAMQSMNLFIQVKGSKKGIRISQENFSKYNNIGVFPLYAISNI
jgi:uncharacterized protein